MLIENILDVMYNFLFGVVFDFEIPPLDTINSILTYVNQIIGYSQLVYKYFIPPASQVMLSIIIIAEFVVESYFVIMWIVRKIPMLNID